MAQTYLQLWIDYAASIYRLVIEAVWTAVPTDDQGSSDASNLLLGGAAYTRTASSPDLTSDTIVIIHHGSVDQFCHLGTDGVYHASLDAFCAPQTNDELIEYIDGYVGWLTSPRDEKTNDFKDHGNNTQEFIEWLEEPAEMEKTLDKNDLLDNDNQEEPQWDDESSTDDKRLLSLA
ncbi:unnamed protein product [Aphanomyces euteiches]|uniref:Uncharacterized protein n=1 Tax=Aphanomyces euteiches TaxID=100861 RepID=A0A6G0XMN5_9STRA|nr:hypothetical protein Ae201684_003320 [Aphanomyces euteiches]KAH9087679.1 hypothetical protein LEN26_019903 [Aphanomyces euteiches]KAH9098524.1 hypothetical protein Ae201684P_017736 [Aphanomyces euteiches]KAH9106856.1 hypothetical protein AeMF1_017635 [Aphanomyces euteiches]KAH9157705.1 hypothetical protein AeRB84_000440 [Aphanomyces euteiches]